MTAVSDQETEINVTIKQLDGSTFKIKCTPTMTVLGLKTLISDAQNISVDRQRLIFRAQELQEDKTLFQYGVIDESIIHIVIRPLLNNNNNNNNNNMISAPEFEGQNHIIEMENQNNVMYGINPPHNPLPPMDIERQYNNNNSNSNIINNNVIKVTKLCRFIKIFSLIDTIFLILYGLEYILFFILAAFAFFGYFGAKNLNFKALLLYIVCLIFEIAFRVYLIIYFKNSIFEVILLIVMMFIDIFVIKCIFDLWKLTPTLNAAQRDSVLITNRMSVC